jgi:type III secretion system FlhB-like substrate exporter
VFISLVNVENYVRIYGEFYRKLIEDFLNWLGKRVEIRNKQRFIMKDIGKKRKNRAEEVRKKAIKRKQKNMQETKVANKKALLEYKTRRKQEPIVKDVMKGQFNDPTVPLSQEREITIVEDHLNGNIEKLKEMEQEFIDLQRVREKKENNDNG